MSQLTAERTQAILQVAAQVDLEVVQIAEQIKVITERLENLRALSAQVFLIQDGTLSDEEVRALLIDGQALEDASSNGAPPAVEIVEEIVAAEPQPRPEPALR